MLRKGAIPIPPAMRTTGLALRRTKEPIGPLKLTSVPSGKTDRARLKAESRIRVATKMSGAKQELAIENVWLRLVESLLGIPRRVDSINWPALNRKFRGLANWNDTVFLATTVRLRSLLRYPSTECPIGGS